MARRLQAAGHMAYFAGGCVRDELLGREPHDYDIATDATPPEVLQLFPRAQYVGAHFGVVVVHEGGAMFEIATFRTDGSYRDGRRPESVTFATPQEDAQRRDFTVNGMFLDPTDGKIIDYVGGRADLQSKVLRAIGDPVQRFREDRLRLMRAVRFAAALDYQMDTATWTALRAEVPSITDISIERVRDEFVRILLHRTRLRGFDLLDASGLLRMILPEMEALKGCSQPNSTRKAMSGPIPDSCSACFPRKFPCPSCSPCCCTTPANRQHAPSTQPREESGSMDTTASEPPWQSQSSQGSSSPIRSSPQ
jgi:poly(A) polymerase